MIAINVGILIVSDRSSQGLRDDITGPKLKDYLTQCKSEKYQYIITHQDIIPDDKEVIKNSVLKWCDENVQLILTSGGTGFSQRDVTPEAIAPLLDKPSPGITTAMLIYGLQQTPFAALSRPISGVIKNSLIITLPGSPKGAIENFSAVEKVLFHAIKLLDGDSGEEEHLKIKSGCKCSENESDRNFIIKNINTDKQIRYRQSPYPMLSIESALNLILKQCDLHLKTKEGLNLLKETASVNQVLINRILFNDVKAPLSIPQQPTSIVDGYALSKNLNILTEPLILKVNETLFHAGEAHQLKIQTDEACRITTGSWLPNECDKVIMIEDTELYEKDKDGKELKIKLNYLPKAYENVRQIGSDIEVNQVLFKKGERIGSFNLNYGLGAELGLLAMANVAKVEVYKKLKVGILSSGDELYDLEALNEPTKDLPKIYDANRPILINTCKNLGLEVLDFGIIKDDYKSIENKILSILEQVDVLITSGGVSMGEKDYIKPILENHPNFNLLFGRIEMKPGKPTTFATYHKNKDQPIKLIFALPGNPVSTLVTFHLLVKPALLKLAGDPTLPNKTISVELEDMIALDLRPEYQRCIISWDGTKFKAKVFKGQQSSRLLSCVQVNGLLKLPKREAELKYLNKGDKVEAILLGILEIH